MKKKLKVKKAFLGKFFGRRGASGRLIPRPGMQPRGGPPQMVPGPDGTPIRNPIFGLINPVRPGMQQQGLQIINGVKQLPDPSTIGSNMVPRPMQPSSQINPNSPRSLPFASAVGPTMSRPPVMPNPSIGAAQAAPVQPVPAMKKGGMVRGQGIAIKGTKFKGIF